MFRKDIDTSAAKKSSNTFVNALKYKEKITRARKSLPPYYFFKVFFEYFLALICLVPFIVFTFFIFAVYKISTKGPVFFKQIRVGQNGKFFWAYKFRTLKKNTGDVTLLGFKPASKIANDPRIDGKIAFFLRKHKLDELPQIINILLGDMSIVGPRPYTLEDNKHLKPENVERFAVRPGMSGYWQALKTNLNDFDEKAILDCKYVRELSLSLDLKIWINTFKVIFNGENFSENPSTETNLTKKSKSIHKRAS